MERISDILDSLILALGRRSTAEVPSSQWKRNLSVLLVVSFIGKSLFFLFGIESGKTGYYLPISEGWMDYAYAYVPTVEAFKTGNMPYKDFYHAYPPLFLYVLTAFFVFPYFWSMALPLVVSDALAVIPVYLMGRHLSSERTAFLASLGFALSPINLFYVDYFWLDPPLTTLFLLVSIYCLLERRYDVSAISMAASIGFKQTSLLALPIMMLYMAKRMSRKNVLRYFAIVASICFAFSIPYIFIEPRLYLFSVFRIPIGSWGELPKNYFQLGFTNPSGSTAIDTATLNWYQLKWMKYMPLNAPSSLSLPIFVFLLPETTPDKYYLADTVLKILLLAAYGVLLYGTYRREQVHDKVLVKCVLLSLLILFSFSPVYKYYVAGITPLLVLLCHKRRDLIAFEAFNIAFLVIPRLLTSYLLLLLLSWLLRFQTKNALKLVSEKLRRASRSSRETNNSASQKAEKL